MLSSQTLLTLYCSFAIPYLPIAPLGHTRNSEILEKLNTALKMCSHECDSGWTSLLSILNIPSLSTCCSISKVCLFYKITNNLLYFLLTFSSTNLLQIMLLVTLILSLLPYLFFGHLLHNTHLSLPSSLYGSTSLSCEI